MDRNTVILGAGVTGLTVARHLGSACALFEKEERPGGLCKSDSLSGFTFDRAGHVLHLPGGSPHRWATAMPDLDLVQHRRRAWVRSSGCYTEYPFQVHTYGLPEDVVQECVSGMEEAGTGHGESSANFHDWILSTFGKGFAKHFFVPYNEKFWACPLAELGTDWAQRFIPVPSLEEVARGSVGKSTTGFGYNTEFYYPRNGGIGAVADALHAEAPIVELGCEAVEILLKARRVKFSSGTSADYEHLVSTLPLPALVSLLDDAPLGIRDAATALKHVSLYSLNFGISRPNVSDMHWVYFPEKDTIFHRAVFPGNFSPSVAPPDHSTVSVEISYAPDNPLSLDAARDSALRDLVRNGVMAPGDEPVVEHHFNIATAYCVPHRDRNANVARITDFLAGHDISSIGRFGSWQHMSIHDCIMQAESLAHSLAGAGQ